VVSRDDRLSAQQEAALAQGAAAGRRESFGELARHFEGALFRYLLARCASREDAEELTQETLLRAWRKIDRYDPRWRFSTWLFTLARRLAVSRQRRMSLALRASSQAEELVHRDDARGISGSAEARAGLWDLAERVLGAEQRSTLWLRYAEGLTAEEIGRVQGRRAGAVRAALHRARRTLALHLDPGLAVEPADALDEVRSTGSAAPILEVRP
jgi:RNA polymerase sigma-70 factor, ECF subfamily